MDSQASDQSNKIHQNVNPDNQQALPENPAHDATGFPDADAQNFDSIGDLEGMQLGIATHKANTTEQPEEQTLLPVQSPDQDKNEEGLFK